MEAAVHAILARLRRHIRPTALFAAYESGAAADFALIRSLVESNLSDDVLWMVRDASFHLRWAELMGPR